MTDEHYDLQGTVARECEQEGWQAAAEVHLEERRVDVLATKGDRRVAFEIQLSPITLPELDARTGSYVSRGFEAAWLVGPDVGIERLAGRPVVLLNDGLDAVEAGGREWQLEAFVADILARRVVFRQRMAKTTLSHTLRHARAVTCPCGVRSVVCRLVTRRAVGIGCKAEPRPLPEASPGLLLVPNAGLWAWVKGLGSSLPLAEARVVHGQAAFACAGCRTPLGEAAWGGTPVAVEAPGSTSRAISHVQRPHWCLAGPECA